DVLRPAGGTQHVHAPHRVLLGAGVALPVEVVDQACEAPALLVLAVVPRIRAHRGLDRVAVLAQVRVADPLVHERHGLLARGWGARAWRGSLDRHLFSKCLRFLSMNDAPFSGTPLSGKIACTGHAASHAWQSMHSSGWM